MDMHDYLWLLFISEFLIIFGHIIMDVRLA